nr:Maf family protein [Georgenia faecalis]
MRAVRLLLASASPARRTILRAAGIEPLVEPSGVDEPALLAAAAAQGPVPAAEQVLLLARAKARDVASRAGVEVLVLGCDSMLELDGDVLGKPDDAADAVRRWHRMRGRRGLLHTGHWLVRPSDRAEVGATSTTAVTFADVTDAEIEAYVATGEPLAVAGAFTIDGLGGPFVSKVEGDPHGVVGLSLPLLRDLLGRLGVAVTDLWTLDRPAVPGAADDRTG